MLKLTALDEEDFAVLALYLYQARLRPSAMLREQRAQRFLAPLYRCNWEGETALSEGGDAAGRGARELRAACAAETGAPAPQIAAVLRFERVLSARFCGFDRREKQRLLTVEGVRFCRTTAPAGVAEFVFREKARLQLELECIEAQLTDLSA